MKHFLCYLLLSFLFPYTIAQKIWFYDNFNDNSRFWNLSQNKDIEASIANGNLLCEIKNVSDIPQVFLKSFYINPNKEFELNVVLGFEKTSKSGTAGIAFGGKDNQNFYCFLADKDGNYSLYKFLEGKKLKISDPTPSKIPINPDSFCLGIQFKEQKLLYKINGKAVFFSKAVLFMGFQLGFCFANKGKFVIREITIKQDNDINLPENYISGFVRENMGKNINSIYTEKVPLITHDGKTLFYAIRGEEGNLGYRNDDEIWYCEKLGDTAWTKRKNIGFPLNNEGHNFVISVSPDNNTMLMNNTYTNRGKYKGIGFSITHRTKKGGWTIPQDVIVENYKNLNEYKEACLSPDGKVLMLAIQTESSYGDRDLYVSFLKADSTWTEPKNIGNTINTLGTEMSPFIAADGTTLYFATNGLPGYGEHDIFMSKRLDDSWTNWSSPVNLGPEINSPGWDAYYTIPASGEYAFFVSTYNSIGKEDIFRVIPPEALRPKPTVLVYGKVLNSKTLQPIEATITYRELESDKVIGIARSEPENGNYKIVLPGGMQYGFLAEKENFASVNENIDLRNLGKYNEVEQNLYLAPLEIGQTVRLNNIFFDFDKSTLRKESYPELNRVVALLKKNPKIKIEIAGHTDNIGDDAYNLLLSGQRANAVRKYLIDNGIAENRITAKGYGETKPLAPNDSDKNRQLNRRVEFEIKEL